MKSGATHQKITALTLVLVATVLLHGATLANWWCCDDTQILKHAYQFSPHEYFFVPDAWRALVPYSLTPWLTLSYDLDLALFGFNPHSFYVHNLLAIALCAMLLYLIARQWVNHWYALGGALLFLAGSPISVAAQQLMVRHYVEGLLFYLLAMWLAMRGIQTGLVRYAVLAGLAFAIAASAKEIYLPLGLLFFLLPLGNFHQRLNVGWPILLVMALYVPWRWFMLGDVVGGYTPPEELMSGGRLEAILREFANIPRQLWTLPGIALMGVGLAAILAWRKKGRSAWRSLTWLVPLFIALLLPLVPLVGFPGLTERYFIALWATLALVFAIFVGQCCAGKDIWRVGMAILLFGMVAYPAWDSSRRASAGMAPVHAEHRAQGVAIAERDQRTIIFSASGVPSWYSQGMRDLRPAMGHQSPPPVLVADESELVSQNLRDHAVLRFDPVQGRMTDITQEIPGIMARWREKLRAAPLSVDIEYNPASQVLRWHLGSAGSGRFLFLAGGTQQPVPPEGLLRTAKPLSGCFRIRLDSSEGWVAYSPPFSMLDTMTTQAISRLTWKGAGDLFDRPSGSACQLALAP